MSKLVVGVSDPGCKTTEDGKRLEISNLIRRDCTIYVGNQLRSCSVPFFAYAKERFSYDVFVFSST